MEFNFKDLFKQQAVLDKEIQQIHKVTYSSTRKKRFLAFLVELGEFSNATRCFKFWSNKADEGKERIIDEYVDGLHFILSIGLDFGYEFDTISVEKPSESLTDEIVDSYKDFMFFVEDPQFDKYIKAFTTFLGVFILLGYDEKELVEGYYKKLKINHIRQETNY